LDRVLGREPGERPMSISAEDLRPGTEDVYKSFRY
jgi:hypothetical protein